MGMFEWGLARKTDSPEGRRRLVNAGRLRRLGRRKEAREEAARGRSAWSRDAAIGAYLWAADAPDEDARGK